MVCQRLMPAVSGLEKDFPGKVTARNVDAFSDEGKKAAKELGFQNHGLVIRDGSGKALWSAPDHSVDMAQVRNELRSILS